MEQTKLEALNPSPEPNFFVEVLKNFGFCIRNAKLERDCNGGDRARHLSIVITDLERAQAAFWLGYGGRERDILIPRENGYEQNTVRAAIPSLPNLVQLSEQIEELNQNVRSFNRQQEVQRDILERMVRDILFGAQARIEAFVIPWIN